MLQTAHNESLARAIEVSLASQTFRKLTPFPSPPKKTHKRAASSIFRKLIPSSKCPQPAPTSARELLEVVAFFPQGIDEDNLDWLFPTFSNRKDIFDKFCILSLTYRSNGFVTMLAPIREYPTPRDARSSPLLSVIRDRYFSRLSVDLAPGESGFGEAAWIVSEDVNVEHLLDVFLSVSPGMDGLWDSCDYFVKHIFWHQPRQTVLRSKIEALSDDHPSKLKCLFALSWLFARFINFAEAKRLFTHTLRLARPRG